MKKVFLSRVFLIGLSAYLNRLALSVDRALREPIQPLRDCCNGKVYPTLNQVITRFNTVADMIKELPPYEMIDFNLHFFSILKAWFQWYFYRGIFLSKADIDCLYTTLRKLALSLEKCEVVDPVIFVLIRLHLTKFSSLCIRSIPERHIRKRVYLVEHHNQNSILKTKTLDEICNHEDWLASKIELRNW